MKCTDVGQQLSAFYDGELGAEARDAVGAHLAECGQCAAELAGFESLTNALAELPRETPPPLLWERISAQLNAAYPAAKEAGGRTRRVDEAPRRWAAFERLAIAASILLLVGLAAWYARPRSASPSHHHDEFAITMDHYLKTLSDDPDGAERFLLNKYNGQTVAPEAAVRLVGYRPAVAEGLPEGYSLASTSVLKMPCCTCFKAVCKRGDGSTLVLFEHDDATTDWFGGRPANMAMCAEKECCLVDLDSSIAATWKRGSRMVTAVGVRDAAEVNTLVSWLDGKVNTTL